ncbi:MAG: alpha/beta hydrolase [Novosphingobium sp.]
MTDNSPTSNSFISQRLRMHYVDWGNPDAPLLILQHGGRDHCRSWDWIAADLARDWHVVAPDLRGHGDSAWSPEGQYTIRSYVYDFAQLIHTLGQDQVTIIAHSLGGDIATRYTGLYPEKVRKLVNIEGLGPPAAVRAAKGDPGLAEGLRQWIADKRAAAGRQPRRYNTIAEAYARMKAENGFLSDEQARHLTIHGVSRNEDGTWSWKFDNYLNVWGRNEAETEEMEQLWAAITCPVLLLSGETSFFAMEPNDPRPAFFRDSRHIEYADAGHWLHHDQQARFIADVRAFLAE